MEQEQIGLFQSEYDKNRPLAYLSRPKTLKNFIGQPQLTKRVNQLNFKKLPHIIFYGPPGCGKTTMAHIMANESQLKEYPFNAVLGGVNDLRKIIKQAKISLNENGKKSIIFIDEIHRFNKAQQDALLPYLEDGTFILFGATTENPNNCLNQAILSRVQRWPLYGLTENDITQILYEALEDPRSKSSFTCQDSCKKSLILYLAKHANGDARSALNQLETLIQNNDNIKNLSASEIIKNYLFDNRRYDKNNERHYDVISAFIKSVRGSDVDSSVLWLAVMLDGGEDIEFIARRLIILASEDIGNADPRALNIATSAHYAIKQIGMPEARIILSQATAYLANAPKSNASYMAINKAIDFIQNNPTQEVPLHLRNNHPDRKHYKYPHDFHNHWIQQEYSPSENTFYVSSHLGYEKLQDDYLNRIKTCSEKL